MYSRFNASQLSNVSRYIAPLFQEGPAGGIGRADLPRMESLRLALVFRRQGRRRQGRRQYPMT